MLMAIRRASSAAAPSPAWPPPVSPGWTRLLQAMLGLQQDAPRGKLYADPALPDWLPDVTLSDLRLGQRRFDIRFWRDGKDTVFKVLKGKPDAVERMSMTLSGSMANR
jgi:hypothetical protein